jgi:LCP family protein required for cell wall assembly
MANTVSMESIPVMRNMTKKHKSYIKLRNTMIGIILVGIVVFVWYGYGRYREREAEAAIREELKNVTAAAEETLTDSKPEYTRYDYCDPEFYHTMSGAREQLIQNSDGTLAWQGKTYRRNTYIKAYVGIGVDRGNDMTETHTYGESGQADAVFVIVQDTARNAAKVLMIPRDTITTVSLMKLNGIEEESLTHLNMAYAFGDGRETSCENVRSSVEYLLCGLDTDGYLAVDHAVTAILNDAVGGVTVTIPTDGMEKSDPSFIKGTQVTLHGKQAEAFIRYRDIQNDNSALYRMDQHKEYIFQFFQAVKDKSKEDSQIVTNLFELIRNYMVTDLSKAEYLKIGTDALTGGIDSADILTLPGNGVVGGQFDEFYVDYNNAIPLILSLFYREV